MDAIATARAVVEEHHPDAQAAFLGGSVVTARRTPMSDLDIVVILRGSPAPYRASFRSGEWLVEMFVHTEATWHSYVDREVRKRRSPLLWMCSDGILLLDKDGTITDLLDDLAGSAEQGERLFIATELVRRSAELALTAGESWNGGGKWLARRLKPTAPGLDMRLHDGLRDVLAGRVEPLTAVVDEVLEQVGGRLWVGYQRGATP